MRLLCCPMALWLFFSLNVPAADSLGLEGPLLRSLPKVPAQAALLKAIDAKQSEQVTERINTWASELIAAKEKRALIELKAITARAKQEQADLAAAEQERRRRKRNYDQAWGVLGSSGSTENSVPIHLQLDFNVPEIQTYRLAVASAQARLQLIDAIVEYLPKLDRNADGKLIADEYTDCGALLNVTVKLLHDLDANEDGCLSEAELENARVLPRSTVEALRAGSAAAAIAGFRIKTYDVNANEVLEIDERKELTMRFVEAGLRARQAATFYQQVADALQAAQRPVAERFAHIEITP